MKPVYLLTSIFICLFGVLDAGAYKVQFAVFDMNTFENAYGAKIMFNNVEGIWETDAEGLTPVIEIPEDKAEGLEATAYWNSRVKTQNVGGLTEEVTEPTVISISSTGRFKLKVKAIDQTSAPVSGAKVTLNNVSGEWLTDENGETEEISVQSSDVPGLTVKIDGEGLEGTSAVGYWSQYDNSRSITVSLQEKAPVVYKVQFAVFDMNTFENAYGAKIMFNNVEGIWETDAEGLTPVIEIPEDKAEGLEATAYWNSRVKTQNVGGLTEEVTEPTVISISSTGRFKLKVKAIDQTSAPVSGAKVTLNNVSGEWLTDENGETEEISVQSSDVPGLTVNISGDNYNKSVDVGYWSQYDSERTLSLQLDIPVVTYTLNVNVVDENNQCIADALVTLNNVEGEWKTNENGEVTVESTDKEIKDDLKVTASKGGYETQSQDVAWGDSNEETITVILKKTVGLGTIQSGDVRSTEWYDIKGVRVSPTYHGIKIRVDVHNDGSRHCRKITD